MLEGLSWQQNKGRLILFALALAAAVLYGSFSFGLPARFNSPDEAANAFFAGRLAQADSLTLDVPLNEQAGEPIVHPRSTQVIQGKLAPVSFLGLSLVVGGLGRIFGTGVLPYVTPLGAVLGLVCFYLILKELFDRRTAILSSVLLALLPAFWYYHARSFFHNALFFDFLLLSTWCLIRGFKVKHWGYYLATGLAFGVALALRTSEVFWMLASATLWLGLMRRQVVWRYLWLTAVGAAIAFSPVLATNYSIYGSIFSFGYRAGLAFPLEDLQKTASLVSELLLPFGFHPRVIVTTAVRYLWQLTWWWTVLAAGGLMALGIRRKQLTIEQRAFALKGFLACVWLVVVYGSWQFNDNPDPTAITLGTSYMRYFLPLFAFLLWPAGMALARLWDKRWGKAVVVVAVTVYAVLSAQLVLLERQEGLLQVRANILRFEAWSKVVQELTPPESVIVTGFTDKIFWPERQVIYTLTREQDFLAVAALLRAGVPVYDFHPTWQPAGLTLLNIRLRAYSLGLTPAKHGFQDFSLYQFSLAP